jgi:hypothetical protein
MEGAKEKLLKLIEEFPESDIVNILDFAEHLKEREEKNKNKEISIQYWDSDIYDEVWKDV